MKYIIMILAVLFFSACRHPHELLLPVHPHEHYEKHYDKHYDKHYYKHHHKYRH